ncbi:hypothetical protein SLEP1_g4218 [Rubroshorea leprosula]|uniref:Uncharacterized protein n=1 Tax=Rubroshorea leprosula TaxID=152421 RepID=A0AAV5HMZ2_9ROSI|nr:hypothetical protein SLEP1_g4218 [Rubroshorea leprosula]
MKKAATLWAKEEKVKYRSDCCCESRESSEEIGVEFMERCGESGSRKAVSSVLLLFLLLILILPRI